MISPEKPVNVEFRILTQAFTKNVAKDGERLHILGRSNHGEERKNLGEDLVKSYVKTMSCAKLHVSSERIPMQKKILILFPSKKEKTISKQHAAAKEKESILNVLAAGLVKTSSEDVESSSQLQNLEVNDVPGLLADAEMPVEMQFPDAFKNPVDNSRSTQIQDDMQDILLQPLGSTLTFRDYFDLFWMVKVKTNFHISDTIVIDFDQQVRSQHSAKDLLRYHRDNKATKQMEAISVTDDVMTRLKIGHGPQFWLIVKQGRYSRVPIQKVA